jgi:tetratricopeptide (TPR) repeat protein
MVLMRIPLSGLAGILAVAGAIGCAGKPALEPISPASAQEQLTAATSAFAADPGNPGLRVAFGRAQYLANQDVAARRTLEPLLATGGSVGAEANLYAGASAQRLGNLADARVDYLRYLSIAGKNQDVEARLGDIARAEAMISAQQSIKNEQLLNPATFPKSAVGVSPLFVPTADTTLAPLGYGVADLLIADLSISPDLQIVDRVRVDAVLRELELSKSGRTDTTSAPALGKLVGASRMVNGEIHSGLKNHITMDAQVTSVERGSIVGKPVSEQTAMVQILDGEKRLALQLFGELGVTLTPAQMQAVQKRPTRYLSAFLAYSRGAAAEAQWNLDAAESYYVGALSIDPGFILAQQRLAAVRSSSGRPRAHDLPIDPDNWSQNILGGVTQGINPSPGDVLGSAGNTTNAPLDAALTAASQGTIIIIIGTP